MPISTSQYPRMGRKTSGGKKIHRAPHKILRGTHTQGLQETEPDEDDGQPHPEHKVSVPLHPPRDATVEGTEPKTIKNPFFERGHELEFASAIKEEHPQCTQGAALHSSETAHNEAAPYFSVITLFQISPTKQYHLKNRNRNRFQGFHFLLRKHLRPMRLSRSPLAVLLVFSLLALPTQAQSQPTDAKNETTVGIGISVSGAGGTINFYNVSPLSLSVPITFSSIRVEPEIGYFRYEESSQSRDVLDSSLLVGTGVFYLSRMDDLQFQIGARIGLSRNSFDYNRDTRPNASTDDTNFDYTIGPAAGGEYYISDFLSLGVEARLLYTDRNRDSSDSSRSLINTDGAAYLRIHF